MADEQAEPDQQAEATRPAEPEEAQESAQATQLPPPEAAAGALPPGEKPRRLQRSRNDRVLAGVAGGIGAYLGIDPVLVRIGFVLATILGAGLGILLYVIGAAVMSLAPGPPDAAGAHAGAALPGAPRRDASTTAALVIGALLIAVGALWLLAVTDVRTPPWDAVLALALIVVGGSLLWESRRARHGGLIAAGAVLAVVLSGASVVNTSIDFDSAFGEQTKRPATFAELEREYDHAFGSLTVDLRGVELPEGTTAIEVSVAFGEAVVWLPRDVPVRVESSATFGSTEVLGVDRGGVDVDRHHQDPDYAEASRRLLVDINVMFGSAKVRR